MLKTINKYGLTNEFREFKFDNWFHNKLRINNVWNKFWNLF